MSVIIPSYDRAHLLRERSIPSVLRQTYGRWEVVVVGDGPADDSLRRAVEGFGDLRIRYTAIPRPGYSTLSARERWHTAGAAARNHGLRVARGEVLAPLDDDDEFLERHLEECAGALLSGADVVYGATILRDAETGAERISYRPWDEPATRARFERKNITFHASFCYAGRYRGLPYPTDGSIAADYGLLRALHGCGAVFTSIPSPQSVYHGASFREAG